MTNRFGGKGKLVAMGLALAGMVAAPLTASAHGWHGGYGGYHGGWGHGYYHHGGGYWHGGRWIAGALVTGLVAGAVIDAARPAPVYYGPRYYPSETVVYREPRTVVYEQPVVTRRVVETRTVYDDPYQTRYVRDDGYED